LADLRLLAAEAAAEGWGGGLENWSAAELSAVAGRENDQTARLEALMKATSRLQKERIRLAAWSVLAAACLLVGILVARFSQPAPLLATVQAGPPRRANPLAQLYHAKTVDSEAAWLSVLEYYPDADEHIRNWVTEGLVRHYLYRGEYEKAIPHLEQLASTSSEGTMSHAFTFAGLTIAYTALSQRDLAAEALEQITPEVRIMLADYDPQLEELFRATLEAFYQRDIQPPVDPGSD
jgi:hypothetical protein